MLVLNRRVGESLVIDSSITIKVISCRGNQVRFGIEAPENTPIFRQELLEQIKARATQDASAQQAAELPQEV